MTKQLVLASSSPRRKKILAKLGVSFSVRPGAYLEPAYASGRSPAEYVQHNAEGKARAGGDGLEKSLVVGADTAVVYKTTVLGKPASRDEAYYYLQMLNGRTHAVYTGLCLFDVQSAEAQASYAKTLVRFRTLSDIQIRAYLDRIDPMDKAGAYAIQDQGALLVEGIRGCYYNVVGFPVACLEAMLMRRGTSLFDYMQVR